MSESNRRLKPRCYVLRRPSLFYANVWYVQRGGRATDYGPDAKRGAHEYRSLKAAKRAQRERFGNYQVWRRGRRAKSTADFAAQMAECAERSVECGRRGRRVKS